MAAQSHVRVSFEIPEYTFDIDSTGVIRCLDALRRFSPETRFVQSSTSELYGSTPAPQDESTPFHPRSPYAAAKIGGYWATVNYREAYGMHASNSISFNHEGERRGGTFVTKKITQAAARIKHGLQNKLYLGNLDAKRDWSHAKDVAMAQYMIATADKPCDYAIGSGESHSVKDFLHLVFDKMGLDVEKHVEFDPRYLRPSEVDHLECNPAKIKAELGWEPEYSFDKLVEVMVEYDLELARKEKLLKDNS
jgi:GDPmannose 4,6-dehydratase